MGDPSCRRWISAVLLIATFLAWRPATSAHGGGDGSSTMAVKVVDEKGRVIESAEIIYHVEGPRTNQRPWRRAQEPIPPMSFSSMSSPPVRVLPGDVEVVAGLATLKIPAEIARLWIEVHHVNRPGSSVAWPAAIFGPLAPRGKGTEVLTLRRDQARTVVGSVVFPKAAKAAKARSGIRVVATPIRPHYKKAFPWWAGPTHAEADVAKDGSYRLSGLGDFAYVLEVRVPTKLAVPNPILLGRGGSGVRRVDPIRLTASVTTSFRVLAPDGKHTMPARLRLYFRGPDGIWRDVRDGSSTGPSAMQVFHETSAGGLVSVSGLNSERVYSLRVIPLDPLGKLLPFLIERWKPKDSMTIRLRP
jgi:hypothetical protein